MFNGPFMIHGCRSTGVSGDSEAFVTNNSFPVTVMRLIFSLCTKKKVNSGRMNLKFSQILGSIRLLNDLVYGI